MKTLEPTQEPKAGTPEFLQRRYYEATSRHFDEWHMEDFEHNEALRYISLLLGSLDAESVLDVGCGTGRGIRYFMQHHPALRVHGVDPARAQLDHAMKAGVPGEILTQYDGVKLPFENGAFDIVCEFGALHHAAQPNVVVSEMTRVARKAVFISDCNRFGDGSYLARVTKLLLYKSGLWPLADRLKTGGKGYVLSDTDGLAYSYSVFDSLDVVACWADRVILIPTVSEKPVRSWFHPLLTSRNILVCGLKNV